MRSHRCKPEQISKGAPLLNNLFSARERERASFRQSCLNDAYTLAKYHDDKWIFFP